MKRIIPKKGLNKKYFGPPLSTYFEQIRQVCDRFGYKISGKLTIELPNGDEWVHIFSKDKEK